MFSESFFEGTRQMQHFRVTIGSLKHRIFSKFFCDTEKSNLDHIMGAVAMEYHRRRNFQEFFVFVLQNSQKIPFLHRFSCPPQACIFFALGRNNT